MNIPLKTNRYWHIALALAILMATTRFHHFGSALSLPDATLAIFFLAGFYLRSALFMPLFLAEAALIDYVAIANGVSAWCVTPAYVFLVPTYASLWLAGRWYAARHRQTWSTLVPLVLALLVATGVTFLISNGSFYLLSGYFADMSFGEYGARVARYFPLYLVNTFMYVSIAVCLHGLSAAAAAFRKGYLGLSPRE